MNISSVSYNGLSLLDVHDLQEAEINHLRADYDIDLIHLDDYISGQQVPKIEVAKNYILVVLDFPFVESEETLKKSNTEQDTNTESKTAVIKDVITAPVHLSKFLFTQARKKQIKVGHVNFFISKDFVIILHDSKTPLIDEIVENCQRTLKKREEIMGLGPNYLFYHMADALIDSAYQVMSEITTMIEEIDVKVLESNHQVRIVDDISITRRNIVYFKSMIDPSSTVFSELMEKDYLEFSDTPDIYWSSLLSKLQKIKYRLSSSKELIEGIANSHESLLTVRTNEIVKVLTMFTAVMLPLTFLASVYGMNIVGLPLADTHDALWMLSIIMTSLAAVMVLIFKLKKWI